MKTLQTPKNQKERIETIDPLFLILCFKLQDYFASAGFGFRAA
jgi:hypothetical protein